MAIAQLAKLKEALSKKHLIKFWRRFEECSIRGYVLDIGPRFFLLSLVSDRIWYDGFECFRIRDIKDFMPDPYSAFAEEALRKREERRPRKPYVSLTTVEKLLLTANKQFQLVTIHREQIDPDVCYIGRVLAISRGHVSLLEIKPDATWDQIPRDYRLSDITRVNFGGDYENALQLVGGSTAR